MKKILLLLVLVLGLFGVEPSILNQVGNVDDFAYSEDKKTLYTLKDEAVTIWNVQPLKKIDSFQTTINHLRNYVSEDINTSYLDRFSSEEKPTISISKDPNRIRVESKYITEQWDTNSHYMTYGGPRSMSKLQVKRIEDKIRIHVNEHKIEYSQKIPGYPYLKRIGDPYSKSIRSIGMIINDRKYYELHLNPFYTWARTSIVQLNHFYSFYDELDWMKEIKYVITYSDGTEEIHRKFLSNTLKSININEKKFIEMQYIVTLSKRSSPEEYNDVWKSKTIEEGMKKLYGTTKSIPLSDDIIHIARDAFGMKLQTKFTTDIKSMAVFGDSEGARRASLEGPALAILQTYAIDMQEENSLSLTPYGYVGGFITDDVNITVVTQSKDNKLYKTVKEFKGVSNE